MGTVVLSKWTNRNIQEYTACTMCKIKKSILGYGYTDNNVIINSPFGLFGEFVEFECFMQPNNKNEAVKLLMF